ncbi:phosphoribosylglycinamide formyltransferase [Clostridia bacterium]|nr:phosphoribosylglycinamide formyltransferase [Clostridia bacterium]
MKIAVLASGRGSNLESLLQAETENRLGGAEIGLVFSDQPLALALERGRAHGKKTACLSPKDFDSKQAYEKALVLLLNKEKIDLVVLAGYMRITGEGLLSAYGGRMINIHPSLLPSFPGLDAQAQAVSHGVKISGCTVHLVDAGMDTGPIIAQRAVPVYAEDTEAELSARILLEEHKLLPQVVSWIARGKVLLAKEAVRFVDEKSL